MLGCMEEVDKMTFITRLILGKINDFFVID